MKVALVVLALVAAAAADAYKPSYHHDYAAPAHYKFDWDVTAEGGYGGYGQDSYKGQALHYGQYEARDGYNTQGNWHTQLPGQSHIKNDYTVNAQGHSYSAPAYKAAEYKPEYKPAYKPAY